MPKQNRAEPFSAYVLRVCSAIDLVRVPSTLDGVPFKETEAETEARHERVNGTTFFTFLFNMYASPVICVARYSLKLFAYKNVLIEIMDK